jgi:hypothetical protein
MKKTVLFVLCLLPLLVCSQTLSYDKVDGENKYSIIIVGAYANPDNFVAIYNTSTHEKPEILKFIADTLVKGVQAVKFQRDNKSIMYAFINSADPYHIKLLDKGSNFSMLLESPVYTIDAAYKAKYENVKSQSNSYLDGNLLMTLFKAFIL